MQNPRLRMHVVKNHAVKPRRAGPKAGARRGFTSMSVCEGGRPMASEGPPQSEDIVCVSVPCREGRERGWRAIELFHQEQRPQRPPLVPRPARRHATRPSRRAGGACNGRRCMPVSLQRHTNARRRLRAREICARRPWRPTALTCFRATSSLLTASVGHASIDQRWIADGISQQKGL